MIEATRTVGMPWDTGTLWLNLGDKYERGELLGMPWRIALALVDEGWRLRKD